MPDRLDQVSLFGSSGFALVLVLIFDWAFTLIHVLEEWRGEKVPIWRNFGAIAGTWIPNRTGFALFTLGLTGFLWAAALVGIVGSAYSKVPLCLAIGALGLIIGGRIADTLVSHVFLYSVGYRPNPGIRSTPPYVIEAVFIVVAFGKGLRLDTKAAWWGFGLGCFGFLVVIPGLLLWRTIRPSVRRERWIPGGPMPSWTSLP